MNDPIVELLGDRYGKGKYKDSYHPEVAKELRQQIGRELLDPNKTTYGYTAEMVARIREVCKLDKQ